MGWRGSGITAWILWLALLPAPPHPAQPAFAFPRFSAEMVTASPVLSPVRVEIYRTRDRLRVNLPLGGYQLYDLKRRHADWVRGQAAIGRCSPAPFSPPPGVLPFLWRGRVTRKRLGAARLYGHAVEIEQITVRSRHGRHVFTAWLAKDLGGFPLRVQFVSAHGPLEINYRDIRLGAPPAALLRLPAACRR